MPNKKSKYITVKQRCFTPGNKGLSLPDKQ